MLDDRHVSVVCCGKRRGLFPGGVLICSACDFNHAMATTMPNEDKARDVPRDQHYWRLR